MEHILCTVWAETGPHLGWVLFLSVCGQVGMSTAFLTMGLTREHLKMEF